LAKFEIHGIDELTKELDALSKKAESLNGEVSFDALFTEKFMRSCSRYNTFYQLLDDGGFDYSSDEAFEAIDESQLDSFIDQNTTFESWEDFEAAATELYAQNKLGF